MAIPVYLFAGFLESGKTSFIASVLLDPGFTRDEHTLPYMGKLVYFITYLFLTCPPWEAAPYLLSE